jgi:seryl-tRNA synthetase
MLDRRLIEEQPELVSATLAARRHQFDLAALLDRLAERKANLADLEALQAKRNSGSREVGRLFKEGKREEGQSLREELALLGGRIAEMEGKTKALVAAIDAEILSLPNLLADEVPDGADDDANIELRSWGEPRSLDFEPADHHDLGERLGILDFERGAKITGSRFTVLKGAGARLSRALMNFCLDRQTTRNGYTEILPPFLVNSASMTGTGQLPKFGDDLFRLQDPDDYWLIPTAEVPVTNMHANEIVGVDELPIRYAAYTPCFRAEAGSYGRDTRGLIRQHQFEKVEMVQFTTPEESEAAHEAMTRHAEGLLQELELPHRVMLLCSGDIGFGAWKCYDIEVWLPGQKKFREISSVSNYRDFQARRAGIRYRPAPKTKPRWVHTLNGSGLPLGRTLVAILENGQQADGSIRVPVALQPYFGGDTISA